MLSKTGSLIPKKELDNGGKLDSTNNTGLTESEFKTEEIAAETDWEEPKFMLTSNCVEPFQWVPKTDSGMM
jgi:hypothetical protein